MTNPDAPRRVALIADASFFVGPALARVLAARGHDLAISHPLDGLVEELEAMGSTVAVIDAPGDLADPAAAPALAAGALERFGHIDSACAFSGQIVIGGLTESTVDDLHAVRRGWTEAA